LKTIYYLIIGLTIVILIVLFFSLKEQNKKPYSLEIDATKDKTDISGTMYRVKVTNTGTNHIQNMDLLEPGQSFFFYPKPDTNTTIVKVTTTEGIEIESNYRSPMKGIGLPGSGR
jgi:mRNA deadenylase 3'-5' endonuclease subunit Ccr4